MIDFSALNSACLSAFGRTVTYTPVGGSAVEVTAIPSEAGELEPSTLGAKAKWFCQAADFDALPERGDTMTAGAVVYEIERVDADEEGGVVIWGRKR